MNNTIVNCVCDFMLEFSCDIENLLPILVVEGNLKKIERLAVGDIPRNIRTVNPNLKFQPVYRITSEEHKISVMFGEYIIIFNTLDYKCWDDFSQVQKTIINKLIEKNIIAKISRIGLRYINLIKEDFAKNKIFSFKINDKDMLSELSQVSFFKMEKDIAINTTIASQIDKKQEEYITDITVAFDNDIVIDPEIIDKKIEEMHEIQKIEFKSINSNKKG
ncbi:TIGR04255 family protein [Campylobacter coli]|nr:TIGR04255 family protein [Campylobacter coli]